MSVETKFYNPAVMIKAEVIDATTNSADAISNLADFNPNTTWTAGTTADQFIMIDTHQTSDYDDVEAYGIYIANYKTDWGVGDKDMQLRFGFSDDDISYTYLTTIVNAPVIEHNGGRIFMFDFGLSLNHRYYALNLINAPASGDLIEIGQVFLATVETIETRGEYPLTDVDLFLNDSRELANGRIVASARALSPVRKITRKYSFISDAQKLPFDNVYAGCGGRRRPFLMNEGSGVEDILWMHFMRDEPQVQEIDEEFFRVTMQAREVPYIEDGEVF